MKELYTSIPVGLCQYCICNRKINHLKVYLYFKFTSSGHVKYINSHLENTKEIAEHLQLNEKTVKNCLTWLIQNEWITTYSNIKSLRVISYRKLCDIYDIKTTCAVIYENETFEDLRNFCCAVLIIYYRNYKRWCDRKSVPKKGGARLRTNKKSKGYYPLPCLYLAKCLNVSKKTAHKYKRAAMEYGHIEVRKNLKILTINGMPLTNEHKGSLKFITGISLGRVRTGNKFLKYVDADLIKSNLYMKKKRY
ncbi:hypothetical protein [Aquimarina sp. 2201CG14-23]|uniref:hypothetical protein n=1 Tax=Aquimarina mycalae TaxID=3040073 RepID=UPI002477F343|nr:hypothetical protein [Aquimarina sp. 2201CG14-23]MDH7448405.1 hypothetical protein [Aquimarina sp. 2201CG14-23]